MEVWKKIPGHEYEASTEGRIRACATGRILTPYLERKPYQVYQRVELWYGDDGKRFHVHRLVLEAFVGPRPPGKQCRHLDGAPLNNRPENLAWGSSDQDRDDRLQHRQDYYLTPEDVALIRAHPEKTGRALAAEIGCVKQTVYNVRSGKHFSDWLTDSCVAHAVADVMAGGPTST